MKIPAILDFSYFPYKKGVYKEGTHEFQALKEMSLSEDWTHYVREMKAKGVSISSMRLTEDAKADNQFVVNNLQSDEKGIDEGTPLNENDEEMELDNLPSNCYRMTGGSSENCPDKEDLRNWSSDPEELEESDESATEEIEVEELEKYHDKPLDMIDEGTEEVDLNTVSKWFNSLGPKEKMAAANSHNVAIGYSSFEDLSDMYTDSVWKKCREANQTKIEEGKSIGHPGGYTRESLKIYNYDELVDIIEDEFGVKIGIDNHEINLDNQEEGLIDAILEYQEKGKEELDEAHVAGEIQAAANKAKEQSGGKSSQAINDENTKNLKKVPEGLNEEEEGSFQERTNVMTGIKEGVELQDYKSFNDVQAGDNAKCYENLGWTVLAKGTKQNWDDLKQHDNGCMQDVIDNSSEDEDFEMIAVEDPERGKAVFVYGNEGATVPTIDGEEGEEDNAQESPVFDPHEVQENNPKLPIDSDLPIGDEVGEDEDEIIKNVLEESEEEDEGPEYDSAGFSREDGMSPKSNASSERTPSDVEIRTGIEKSRWSEGSERRKDLKQAEKVESFLHEVSQNTQTIDHNDIARFIQDASQEDYSKVMRVYEAWENYEGNSLVHFEQEPEFKELINIVKGIEINENKTMEPNKKVIKEEASDDKRIQSAFVTFANAKKALEAADTELTINLGYHFQTLFAEQLTTLNETIESARKQIEAIAKDARTKLKR